MARGPTVFESVGASTTNSLKLLFSFFNSYINGIENVVNLAIPWQKIMSSIQSFKFLIFSNQDYILEMKYSHENFSTLDRSSM